jgi:hypothetical protein
VQKLKDRIAVIESRLGEIDDADYYTAAKMLLSSIRFAFELDSPQSQIFNCGAVLLYVELKKQEAEPFVAELLQNIADALVFEYERWQGKTFSGQTSKAVSDAIAFLHVNFSTILKKNAHVAPTVEAARQTLRKFRALFPTALADDVDELLSFFKQYPIDSFSAGPYPQTLDRLFNYGATSERILEESYKMLDRELKLVDELIPKLGKLEIDTKDTRGDIYDKLTQKYQTDKINPKNQKLDVLAEAGNIMKVVNKYIECYVQDIPNRPIILKETPNALVDLVTSGATVALDYLTPDPNVFIFVTKEKNTSWLTLLNVLVHEATHAYQPTILAKEAALLRLVKLRNWVAIPFMEATAFHREFEIFEEVKEAELKRRLNNAESELLKMFDASKFANKFDVDCFELETRVWRIMRALRSICDIEVNSGTKTYVDFVNWAAEKSGLKKEFINDECFTFLSSPGYTPSYSFCGSQYADLQSSAKEEGITRLDFNTQANAMGLWPWTLCVSKMESFRPSTAQDKG